MEKTNKAVEKLISLNFTKTKALHALKETNGNYDMALKLLQNEKKKKEEKNKTCAPAARTGQVVMSMSDEDYIGEDVRPKQKKHPCIVQYKCCSFGDKCLLREYPGDVCINHFWGSCVYGDVCKKRHFVDGINIRDICRLETDYKVKHEKGVVRNRESCGGGVFLGELELTDEVLPTVSRSLAASHCFDPIQSWQSVAINPNELDRQQQSTAVAGSGPAPFLEAVLKKGQKSPITAAASIVAASFKTELGPPRAKHPCVAQFGSCKYGKNCDHADRDADVCVLYLNGRCNRGVACKNRHESDEEYVKRLRPDVSELEHCRLRSGKKPATPENERGPLEPRAGSRQRCSPEASETPKPSGTLLSDFLLGAEEGNTPISGVLKHEEGEGVRDPNACDDAELEGLTALVGAFPTTDLSVLLCAFRCANGDENVAADVLSRLERPNSVDDIQRFLQEKHLEDNEAKEESKLRARHECFLTLCTLFPDTDTTSIQAVLDKCDSDYAEAYSVLLFSSGALATQEWRNTWSYRVKAGEEARMEKLCGMFKWIPPEVVCSTFTASGGEFSKASDALNKLTRDMGALGCGATEECIYVPPKTKSSAITRPQLASEERLSEVPDQLRRPSLPLKEVEAYYKSVKNELREFGDWRRVRERAYLINKYRIRVLSHATAAYMRGDGAVAKALSCRGKELGKEYERLNRIAMIALEREITERDPETTLDLHGFHVVEAIDVVRRRVELCLGKGIPNLRIVTGRGNHSRKGYSKIATAVGEQLQKDPYLKNRVKIKLIKPCYIEVGILLTRK